MSSGSLETEPGACSILDMDVEQKLRLAGMAHLIPKVRELERRIDPVALDLLDKLLLHRAKHDLIKYDRWLSRVGKHYAALQLEPGASLDDIKRRFRRLARLHHPDVGGDTESMQLITEAYEAIVADLKKQRC